METIMKSFFGQSYFYCVRKQHGFECMRYDDMLPLDADNMGRAHFAKEEATGVTQLLWYRSFWPNWCVKYFLKYDLAKTFHRLPVINNHKTWSPYNTKEQDTTSQT